MPHDAFISYSHAGAHDLAAALQSALERFAKPWYRRRRLDVFRDDTGLSVSPALWSSIQAALDGSEWFVLLASPEAASSTWVNREIDHWQASHGAEHILPVVVSGEWVWDARAGDFDLERSTAVPPSLSGSFTEEPLHLDLRWIAESDQLERDDPRFRTAVAQLASPMHGVPPGDLVGEDARLHRRAVRLARVTAGALAVLLAASVVATMVAARNASEANANATQSESRRLAAEATAQYDEAFDVGLLLAVEAMETEATPDARSALFAGIAHHPGLIRHLDLTESDTPPPGPFLRSVAMSPSGRTVVAGGGTTASLGLSQGVIDVWDVGSGDLVREDGAEAMVDEIGASGRALVTGSTFHEDPVYSASGKEFDLDTSVATVTSADRRALLGADGEGRAVLVDAETGGVLSEGARVSYERPPFGFSGDGSIAALPIDDGIGLVSVGPESRLLGILHGIPPIGTRAVTFEYWNPVAVALDGSAVAVLSESGSVYFGQVGGRVHRTGGMFGVDISADGSTLAVHGANRIDLFDIESGAVLGTTPLDNESGTGTSFALSHNGRLVLVVDDAGAHAQSAASGETRYVVDPEAGHLLVSPDRRMAVVWGADPRNAGSIRFTIVDLDTGRPVATEALPGAVGIAGAQWSPDGRRLATWSNDLMLWQTGDHTPAAELVPPSHDTIVAVAFDAESSRAAVAGHGDAGYRLQVLDLGSASLGEVLSSSDPENSLITYDGVSGRVLKQRGTTLSLFRAIDDPEPILEIFQPRSDELFLVPGGRRALLHPSSNDADGRADADLLDAHTLEVVAEGIDCGSGPGQLSASADGSIIVDVGLEDLFVCDATTGVTLHRVQASALYDAGLNFDGGPALVSRDGSRIYLYGRASTVATIDFSRGGSIEVQRLGDDDSQSVVIPEAIDPRTGDVALSSNFEGVLLADPVHLDERHGRLDGPVSGVAMAYSPDGTILAVGGDDFAGTSITLWDVETQQQLGEPLVLPLGFLLRDLQFSIDGRSLVAVDPFGGLVRWPTSAGDWQARACTLAGRNFSDAEWERWFPGDDYRTTCPDFDSPFRG